MSPPPDIWAVINQKGGVGKTTTAVALAAGQAGCGRRSLLIDLDPHASASRYFGREGDALFQSLRDGTSVPVAQPTSLDGLFLLPASSELATLGRDGNGGGVGLALKRLLTRIKGFDAVVVDGPPTLGVLMINALAAADRLIVPTLTDPLALHGVAGLDRTLSQIERSLGHRPPWLIVATQFDRRTRSAHDGLRALEARWGDAVWDEVIPQDTQVREASALGLTLDRHAPDCRAARAYRHLHAFLCGSPNLHRSAA